MPHLARLAWGCVLLGLVAGCCDQPSRSARRWTTMGTLAALHGADDASVAAVQQLCRRHEEIFSAWSPTSELSRVNAAAGTAQRVPLSPDLAAVLQRALLLRDESGGAFNPLLGPISRLWGFLGAPLPAAEPTAETIDAARRLTTPDALAFDPETATCQLTKPGAQLDLGGIAKGYAVDCACELLVSNGVSNALMDLGGNLKAVGDRVWKIGIRDPFRRGEICQTIELHGGEAAATSGGYERAITIQGRRHAHILDGRTGRPCESGVASVTVIAPSAAEADALSPALFILGREKGEELLARHPGCRAIWIHE